ncbi:class I SAM-dependent methyltransferase [candidate division KSB1 bacterium]|nr:class I SAM-dependent methyltransferase [candidate division KSB1 bacterium]
MRLRHHFSTIVIMGISLVLLVVSSIYCQKKGRWSEEWEQRFEVRQPTGQIMDSIGVVPGMVIGEVGAGNGRVAVKMATRVGESGKVFANDIDSKALNFMRERCERENIRNMVVVEGRATDPMFPKEQCDLVYMINTYHHLDDPVSLLKNIASALKPNGRLVIIEADPAKAENMGWHSTPKEKVLAQAAKTECYEPVAIKSFLRDDNIYIFRKIQPGK